MAINLFHTSELHITKTFTYDHAGRLEKVEQQIAGDTTNGKVVLAQNDYNELGELMLKKLHSANDAGFVQDIDYLYDVRGWLKQINNMTDTTAMKLYAQYLEYQPNGNIASMVWKNTQFNIDNWIIPTNKQAYSFTYDGLNRMTAAAYSEISPTNLAVPAKANFFDENPSYDLNGNITTLARLGNTLISGFNKGLIDNLAYAYLPNSNQIASITDTGIGAANNNEFKPTTETFTYDANGNTTYAPHKQAALAYNYLNLPNSIAITGQGTINYTYDAAGNKLVKAFGNTTNYYQGNILKIDGKPIILTGEGRAVYETTGWNYEYDLKDHLGNTRISFGATGNNKVNLLQATDYYPFGLEMANNHVNSADATKFRYAGKEMQDEGGLNWIDFSARLYDPIVPHFLQVDPLAEKSRRWSPYTYGYDAPLTFIDADGMVSQAFMDDLWHNSGSGSTSWTNNGDGTFSSNTGKTVNSGEDEPQKKIVSVNDDNKDNISKVSWGETSGLYPVNVKKDRDGKGIKPMSKELFNPTYWDSALLQQLLKTRAAINLIAGRNGSVFSSSPNLDDSLEKLLAAYHLVNNFPAVDTEIKDDSEVKFYYLSSDPEAKTPSISSKYWNQTKVKTYGPFYSVGGGDAGGGQIYVHFYKAIKK